MRSTRSMFVLVLLLIFVSAPHLASAQTEEAPPSTASVDPDLDKAVLELRLLPLTKAELEQEVDRWLEALQERTAEISRIEIEMRTAEGEAMETLRAERQHLATARDALLDRVEIVLDEYETKGGDPEEARKYVDAVSGLEAETDVSALAALVYEWARSPEGGIRWAKNIGLSLVYIIAFWILSRILGGVVRRAVTRVGRASALLIEFLVNVTRKATLVIGLILAASALEINVGPMLAAVGAVGFILAFALQETLGNFAAGMMILMYRPFDVGDGVKVAGVSGKVAAMTMVSTTINTFDNQVVVVPNSKIWGDVITNVTGSRTRRVDMTFGIGYDDDVDRARETLERIVTSHPLVLDDPAPVIRLHELADSSVNFVVRPWSRTDDYWSVYWDVTREVKKRFDAEGISIPFPQRDVHLHQVSPGAA